MTSLRRQFILFSIAAIGYGLASVGSLFLHDRPIHVLVRLIGFIGFGVSAILAYKKNQSSKVAA